MIDTKKLDGIRERHKRLRDEYRGAAMRMRDTVSLTEQFRSDALRALSDEPARNKAALVLLALPPDSLRRVTQADIADACTDARASKPEPRRLSALTDSISTIVSAETLASKQRAETDALSAALRASREFLDRAETFALRHRSI